MQKIVSTLIENIVTNKYFYIDNVTTKKNKVKRRINTTLIKYLSDPNNLGCEKGYDPYKPKLTYDRKNPPEEVIQLKEDMKKYKESCLILLDACSLYPSSIHMMEKFGGFPKGNFKKI